MDIKEIQEQAFERGRAVGRREAIEERLAVFNGTEPGEIVAKAETVLEDLYFCAENSNCFVCRRSDTRSTCPDDLLRDAYAVIKALLCGGAEADVRAAGGEDTNVPTNCGNCGNYDREKGEFTEACGVCRVMSGGASTLSELPSPTNTEGMAIDVRKKLVELLCQVQYLGGLEEKIADHLIAHGMTAQGWIPASEPPKEKGCYFVTVKHWLDGKPVVREAFWNSVDWLSAIKKEEITPRVTHWMLLPVPSKGE